MGEAGVTGANGNGVGTGRLPVGTVQRIERLVGGDPVTEEQILQFIGARYRAKNMFYLLPHVAAAILQKAVGFHPGGETTLRAGAVVKG